MLQYAAAMGGEAAVGLRYAHEVATFPETFGPTYMADGEHAGRHHMQPSCMQLDW